jgi:UTP--glucose-1-phosphate uridylyltransferase
MLPIGSRPALELIVEEAKSAGADDITIIISPGKELIREYFKDDKSVKFIYQLEQKGLGHAVLQAAESLKDAREPVLVMLGDALISGCNAAEAMAAISRQNGGASVIGLETVPAERVNRYGIVKLDGGRIVDMVEKPSPEEAPSNLAVAGRYLLDTKIFDYLADQSAGVGGEIQLTDAIKRMLADKPVFGYVYPGRRHDIGNPQGYFKALEAMNENR